MEEGRTLDWTEFFNDLLVLVDEIDCHNLNNVDERALLVEKTDQAIRSLLFLKEVVLSNSGDASEKVQEVITNLRTSRAELAVSGDIDGNHDSNIAVFDSAVSSQSEGPGRPRYHVPENVILSLRDLGFSWKSMSAMLLISRWTLWRRVKELGIANVTGYSQVSDDELDLIISRFKHAHGVTTGRSMVLGFLRSKGLRVQHRRVCESLVRIDPASSRLRWSCLIRRRRYQVPGPNSLWHADGNHSLVGWNFVIHGCVDGFSRYVVYLNCSTNNWKETVLQLFDAAIAEMGVPSRVRTDKGGENVLIWQRMLELRGEHRGSYLAGSSVHNQRIERLWRDVWNNVSCTFYYVFQTMEMNGMLDRNNPLHMVALHAIYVKRINHALRSFSDSWNDHPLRTERNWSPRQLWANGMIDQQNRGMRHIDEMHAAADHESTDDLRWYGVDWYAPSPSDDGLSTVEVADIDYPLSAGQQDVLRTVDPLRFSSSFGMDVYFETLQLLLDG